MAKTVKCTNCGAADLTKTGESEYKCNYCQARIVTDQAKFDFGSFFKTFNPNDLHKRTQTTFHADQTVVKNTSRFGCVIGLITLISVAAGIVVPILVSQKQNALTGKNNTWNLSYTQQVYYATGSKGPVVWVFQEENYNWEKNRSLLKIINPVNNKILYTETVIREHTSSETLPSMWDLFNGGRVMGDTIFFTPKGKGLEGRNIYTAKKIIDQSYFSKKIGNELAEASAYTSTSDPYLRVKSADGVEYLYFPQKDQLLTRDEYNKLGRDHQVEKYFFILAGNADKKYVMRIHQRVDMTDMTGSFHQTYREYDREKKYYSRYYQVSSVDSIPVSHGFFNADIIFNTDTSFVIKYKANLMENAPWVIGHFTVSGQNLWKIVPEQMQVFKNEKNERFDLNISMVNGRLIMSASSPVKSACGINLTTGKTEWTYRIEK